MTRLYEVYSDAVCPRCGSMRTRDCGPYTYQPGLDDVLGGPPDPRVHAICCLDCGKTSDVAPDWHVARVVASWPQELRERHEANQASCDASRAGGDGAA